MPVLSVTPMGGNLSISWQALSSAAGFVLDQASELAATNWVAVTNITAQENGLNEVTIPLTSTGNGFFRLEQP
jgi:hypothetical protein